MSNTLPTAHQGAKHSGMIYAHWFGIVAELVIGCTIFAALFSAPFAVSIKVLVGACVLYFATTADALSSEGEHQTHVVMALMNAVPIHIDLRMKDPTYNMEREVLNAGREMLAAYSTGARHVAFRLAKYALWMAVGWVIGGTVTVD